MTPEDIANLPTPRTELRYAPVQSALGHRVFDAHLTTEGDYLHARTLEQELAAAVMALAEARETFRRIEQALLPDPHDERQLSVDWLRKEIHAAIDSAREDKRG